MSRKGILFVISAPSGSGKTSLCEALCADVHDVVRSVSCTTRAPRAQERDGLDYHFISAQQFAARLAAGDFLEWAWVYGHRYGTPRQPIDAATAAGKDVVLVIDVQGAAQLRAAGVDAVHVFVLPPSWQALKERHQSRAAQVLEQLEETITNVQARLNDGQERHPQSRAAQLLERLGAAPKESEHYKDYDYVLINDSFDQAFSTLKTIVIAERHRVRNMDPALVSNVLNSGT